jgi:hypothetical protein
VITTFTSDGNRANVGDVGIQLDPLVASRLQLLLARPDTRNCDLVDDFFDSNLLHVRDLDLNNVICGAQTILADEIEREGYPDWLLVNPARLPWTNAELVAGVNTLIRWALNTATRLNPTITGDNLRGLAVGAFALSWLYLTMASSPPVTSFPVPRYVEVQALPSVRCRQLYNAVWSVACIHGPHNGTPQQPV